MLSQSVRRFFSESVALRETPREGVAPAQWGILKITGTWNSSPCGPHITRGDNIASPDKEVKRIIKVLGKKWLNLTKRLQYIRKMHKRNVYEINLHAYLKKGP